MSNNKLQHKIPTIVEATKGKAFGQLEALVMKEVKLPLAKQTHEVCWEPLTKSLWVTQMSNSTLVRLTVDEKGMLNDKQDSWTVGPTDGGLHNASLSFTHPGHLWLSLQYVNTLILLDVRPGDSFLEVVEIYQVPSCIKVDGEEKHVGGPHVVRECPLTGCIWAGLKAALDVNSPCAKLSQCCDPVLMKEAMLEHSTNSDHDVEIPNSFAVWHLNRDKYDPTAKYGAKGGTIFPCDPSPPMMAIDDQGVAWVAQDAYHQIIVCNPHTGQSFTKDVPWPLDATPEQKHTGPGIAADPAGNIWMTQLETMASMVRFDKDTKEAVLYECKPPAWAKAIRMIHMSFCKATIPEHHNRIYAIASTLLQDDSTDALVIINMDEDWKVIKGVRIVPLPSQKCACHRVTYCDIEDGDNDCDDGSVFITELSKSKLLQVKVNNDVVMTPLAEVITTDDAGFEHRSYALPDGFEH